MAQQSGLEPNLRDVLRYALGGSAPNGFLDHLIDRQHRWDDELWRKLDEFAYEFRPDLAVWEVTVDDDGILCEQRLPLLTPPDET